MALKKKDWDNLPKKEKKKVIDYVKDDCRIDLESPARNKSNVPGNYSIKEGTTVGGHKKKRSDQYRINANDTKNIPVFLDSEVRERGTKNRIGGSETIKAIMDEGNLKVGRNKK